MFIPSAARNLLFLPARHSPLTTRLPRAKPRGHFLKTHRHTLPCLRRAPNSLGTNWPVFKHPFHPFPPVVILSVAKDLIPPRHPNLLHRQSRPPLRLKLTAPNPNPPHGLPKPPQHHLLTPPALIQVQGSTHARQTRTPTDPRRLVPDGRARFLCRPPGPSSPDQSSYRGFLVRVHPAHARYRSIAIHGF